MTHKKKPAVALLIFATLFISVVKAQPKSDNTVLKPSDIDRITWTSVIAGNIEQNNYQYYALFAALNCIYPNSSASQINHIMADFEKQFNEQVEHDPLLKYRESDAINVAFSILGKMPEFETNSDFSEKAFAMLGITNSFDAPRSSALYSAQEGFNLEEIKEAGNEVCTELYSLTRQYPELAIDAYNTFFKDHFSFDVSSSGNDILKADKDLDNNPVDKFIIHHEDSNGDVTISANQLDSLQESLEQSFELTYENSIKTNYTISSLPSDTKPDQDIQGADQLSKEIEEEQIEAQAIFTGMDALSGIFKLTNNKVAASDISFLVSIGSSAFNAITKYNSEAMSDDGIGPGLLLSFNFVNIGLSVTSWMMTMNQPNPDALILDELGKIEKGISDLYDYNKERFDHIDEELGTIFLSMNTYFRQLLNNNQILMSEISDIADGIYDLRQSLVQLSTIIEDTDIKNQYSALHQLVENSSKSSYPVGFVLTPDIFVPYENQFENFASNVAALPEFSKIVPDNNFSSGLDSHLNLFQQTIINLLCPDSTGGCPVDSQFMVNPTMLTTATVGFMSMCYDWPNYRQIVRTQIINEMDAQCDYISKFIDDISGKGDLKKFNKIYDALYANYVDKVNKFGNFIYNRENEFVRTRLINQSTITGDFSAFRPYNGLDQALPNIQMGNISSATIYKTLFYNINECTGQMVPDNYLNTSLSYLPDFVKIYCLLNLGSIDEFFAAQVSLLNPIITPNGRFFDINAMLRVDCQIHLKTVPINNLTGHSGLNYDLGFVYSTNRIYFGQSIIQSSSAQFLREAFANNCSRISTIFTDEIKKGNTFQFFKFPHGIDIGYDLKTGFLGEIYYKILGPKMGYMGNNPDSLDYHIYLTNVMPLKKILSDTLKYYSDQIADFMISSVSKSSDYTDLSASVDEARAMLVDFIQLTLPISNAFDDKLRNAANKDNLCDSKSLFINYVNLIRKVQQEFDVRNYFKNLTPDIGNNLKKELDRVYQCQPSGFSESRYFDINKVIQQIKLFKVYMRK